MQNQIEKNMTKKQINMIQKIEEEIVYDIDNIPSSPKDEFSENQENVSSGNESDFDRDLRVMELSQQTSKFNSLPQILSQQLGPKNQKPTTLEVNKRSPKVLSVSEKSSKSIQADQLPEILRLLRNGEFMLALRRVKQALMNDFLSTTERLKFMNQIEIIIYKLNNQRSQLRSYLAKDMTYVLNEYQGLEKINSETHKGNVKKIE